MPHARLRALRRTNRLTTIASCGNLSQQLSLMRGEESWTAFAESKCLSLLRVPPASAVYRSRLLYEETRKQLSYRVLFCHCHLLYESN
jgi:hypothetical protein